ncbi:p53 and DNA damage-regulated protein 1 isoform X2 [Dunckerocampus dactyliophorus]|uniref:p53 and DNA damage-regulated protein 1 isoform X2 n=1 Tax=Dunckerocampus dactyliophorus TaxID=161453 RepID=UPI002405F669|nr:p53 and DNA damage-regulated protein 1 isoform X2 [Dunckerocampus dactyliophorus]
MRSLPTINEEERKTTTKKKIILEQVAKGVAYFRSMMDADSQHVVKYLSEVEEAAEDVLSTKQQIVDLDVKRNRNREALNALKDEMCSEKVKLCFGNMFIKFPKPKAREVIQKDQEQLDMEINDLRKGLKAKVNHLNELQGRPELRGYNLLPLSTDEVKAINSLLKR